MLPPLAVSTSRYMPSNCSEHPHDEPVRAIVKHGRKFQLDCVNKSTLRSIEGLCADEGSDLAEEDFGEFLELGRADAMDFAEIPFGERPRAAMSMSVRSEKMT